MVSKEVIVIIVTIVAVAVAILVAYYTFLPVVSCDIIEKLVNITTNPQDYTIEIMCCEYEGRTAYLVVDMFSSEISFLPKEKYPQSLNANKRYFTGNGQSSWEGCKTFGFLIENASNLTDAFSVNINIDGSFTFIPPFKKFNILSRCVRYEKNETLNSWMQKNC